MTDDSLFRGDQMENLVRAGGASTSDGANSGHLDAEYAKLIE